MPLAEMPSGTFDWALSFWGASNFLLKNPKSSFSPKFGFGRAIIYIDVHSVASTIRRRADCGYQPPSPFAVRNRRINSSE